MKVLFVCSGNICRSPMACEYARHRAAASGMTDLLMDSAGLLGIEGASASDEAIRVLAEAGVELRGHRSRGIRVQDVASADLVIAMTSEHLEELERRFPLHPAGGRFLIRAFEHSSAPASGAPELDDPMGHDLDVYRRQFAVIRDCVDHLLTHLEQRR